eukprot:42479_1
MADNNKVWNSYLDKFNSEPKDASQLQEYSKKQDDLPTLNFKDANTVYKTNKGKGKSASGASSGGGNDDEKKADSGAANPLFAALNKGGNITKGLKKVTRDMTNKDKKVSGKITETSKKKASTSKPKKAAPKKVKPAAIRKQGFRIWVENYTEGVEEVKEATIKNDIYIVNCKNTGFRIPTKCKTVIIDSCEKVQVEIEEVLTSVDMVNTKSSTLYLKKSVPTLNIDKCGGPRIVLFQELLDKKPQIVTSMTSDMNISIPGKTADDDFKDVPIPYQFITTVDPDTKKVQTVPMAHMG